MLKRSTLPLLAIAAALSLAAVNSANASQMPMPCGMDGRWDPRTQSCVRHRTQPSGPCNPNQFGCNTAPKPKCNGIYYDPKACNVPGRWPVSGRR